MGAHQSPRPSNVNTRVKAFQTRLYPANGLRPRSYLAFFHEDVLRPELGRYVLATNELSYQKRQPYVHDVTVTILYRGKIFKFIIFFKHHKDLPNNQTVRSLSGVDMDGDVLLVACGKRVNVRNLRNGIERKAADQAVSRLARHLAPFRNRRSFPEAVLFD